MLRIGFIGTGGMGQHHIENIMSTIPGATVVAVMMQMNRLPSKLPQTAAHGILQTLMR